jgi:hypothetical protein
MINIIEFINFIKVNYLIFEYGIYLASISSIVSMSNITLSIGDIRADSEG